MRRMMSEIVFVALWTLTVLGIAGVYWIIGSQEEVAADLSTKLVQAEDAILRGDWHGAEEVIADVHDRWIRIERLWTLHTQHELLEQVKEMLLQAGALVELQDAQAIVPLRLARDQLTTLPRRDRLLWENLL